ncbi:hypothetical protein HanRHA438_Chr17g0800361 [Helianthus annuus]|nr:hypothetical protein HanRHA438_Chr17g0800361 [Helianthus annuus]
MKMIFESAPWTPPLPTTHHLVAHFCFCSLSPLTATLLPEKPGGERERETGGEFINSGVGDVGG